MDPLNHLLDKNDMEQIASIAQEAWTAFRPYAVPVLLGFIAFVKRTSLARISAQISHEFNCKLEALRTQNSKHELVHRVQFETEFNIYREMWTELTKWRTSFRAYRTMMSGPPVKNEHREALAKVFHETYGELDELYKKLLAFKPFVSGQVHSKLESILQQYDSEMFTYWTMRETPKPQGWFEEREKALDHLQKILFEDLAQTISGRIGLLEVRDGNVQQGTARYRRWRADA